MTARAIQNQSKPTTPPGNTSIYIRVVQGRKIKPRIGQTMVLNAEFHNAGLTSHQITPATRGPNTTINVKIAAHDYSPLTRLFQYVVKLYTIL